MKYFCRSCNREFTPSDKDALDWIEYTDGGTRRHARIDCDRVGEWPDE